MRQILFVFLIIFSVASPSIASTDSPKFETCPAVIEAVKKTVRVKLADAESRRYATQIKRAADQPINFAGHFILASWGCGAGCVTTAAVNAKTGAVVMLPFTVSNWPLDVTEPLSFRKDSCLLVIQGSRNERGKGVYYYDFNGTSFKLIKADEDK